MLEGFLYGGMVVLSRRAFRHRLPYFLQSVVVHIACLGINLDGKRMALIFTRTHAGHLLRIHKFPQALQAKLEPLTIRHSKP